MFEDFCTTFIEKHSKSLPKFVSHFQNNLKNMLKEHVFLARKQNSRTSLWTNNNCEFVNHILKQAIQWKPKRIPELIDVIHQEVKFQFLHLRRCLISEGDFILLPRFQKHRISQMRWNLKTEEERKKYFLEFLGTKCHESNKNKNLIRATNANLLIPQVPSLANKPGQRIRPKSSRTQKRF